MKKDIFSRININRLELYITYTNSTYLMDIWNSSKDNPIYSKLSNTIMH